MANGSLGASRVRESFNPSQDSVVDKIKRHTADLIDLCVEEGNKIEGERCDDEAQRLWSLAMTRYEEAAMWAVKGATVAYPNPSPNPPKGDNPPRN